MKVGYRLSPNEELQLLQAERERRRKVRLLQVREQAKLNAAYVRNAVKEEKSKQLNKLAEKLKEELERERQERMKELSDLYVKTARGVGKAHREAVTEITHPKYRMRMLKQKSDVRVANERHKMALQQMKEERDEMEREASKSIISRQTALETERVRSAMIVSLPQPSPDPIDRLGIEKPPPMKPVKCTDLSAFSATHYHIPEQCIIEKAEPTEQGNAMVAAEEEADRLKEVEETKKRAEEERREKARLRHKHAFHKELIKQDYNKMLLELSDLQRADMQRRQKVVAKIPKQIFEPPHRHLEEKQEEQRGMEEAFENMYMQATDYMGDMSMALDPHPPPETPSATESLDISQDVEEEGQGSERISETQSGQPSEPLRDVTNLGDRHVRTLVNTGLPPGGALKKLLSKIKGQRDEWVHRSASSESTHTSEHESTVSSHDFPGRLTTLRKRPNADTLSSGMSSNGAISSPHQSITQTDVTEESTTPSTLMTLETGTIVSSSGVSQNGTSTAAESSISDRTLMSSEPEPQTLLHPLEAAARFRSQPVRTQRMSATLMAERQRQDQVAAQSMQLKRDTEQQQRDWELQKRLLQERLNEIESRRRALSSQLISASSQSVPMSITSASSTVSLTETDPSSLATEPIGMALPVRQTPYWPDAIATTQTWPQQPPRQYTSGLATIVSTAGTSPLSRASGASVIQDQQDETALRHTAADVGDRKKLLLEEARQRLHDRAQKLFQEASTLLKVPPLSMQHGTMSSDGRRSVFEKMSELGQFHDVEISGISGTTVEQTLSSEASLSPNNVWVPDRVPPTMSAGQTSGSYSLAQSGRGRGNIPDRTQSMLPLGGGVAGDHQVAFSQVLSNFDQCQAKLETQLRNLQQEKRNITEKYQDIGQELENKDWQLERERSSVRFPQNRAYEQEEEHADSRDGLLRYMERRQLEEQSESELDSDVDSSPRSSATRNSYVAPPGDQSSILRRNRPPPVFHRQWPSTPHELSMIIEAETPAGKEAMEQRMNTTEKPAEQDAATSQSGYQMRQTDSAVFSMTSGDTPRSGDVLDNRRDVTRKDRMLPAVYQTDSAIFSTTSGDTYQSCSAPQQQGDHPGQRVAYQSDSGVFSKTSVDVSRSLELPLQQQLPPQQQLSPQQQLPPPQQQLPLQHIAQFASGELPANVQTYCKPFLATLESFYGSPSIDDDEENDDVDVYMPRPDGITVDSLASDTSRSTTADCSPQWRSSEAASQMGLLGEGKSLRQIQYLGSPHFSAAAPAESPNFGDISGSSVTPTRHPLMHQLPLSSTPAAGRSVRMTGDEGGPFPSFTSSPCVGEDEPPKRGSEGKSVSFQSSNAGGNDGEINWTEFLSSKLKQMAAERFTLAETGNAEPVTSHYPPQFMSQPAGGSTIGAQQLSMSAPSNVKPVYLSSPDEQQLIGQSSGNEQSPSSQSVTSSQATLPTDVLITSLLAESRENSDTSTTILTDLSQYTISGESDTMTRIHSQMATLALMSGPECDLTQYSILSDSLEQGRHSLLPANRDEDVQREEAAKEMPCQSQGTLPGYSATAVYSSSLTAADDVAQFRAMPHPLIPSVEQRASTPKLPPSSPEADVSTTVVPPAGSWIEPTCRLDDMPATSTAQGSPEQGVGLALMGEKFVEALGEDNTGITDEPDLTLVSLNSTMAGQGDDPSSAAPTSEENISSSLMSFIQHEWSVDSASPHGGATRQVDEPSPTLSGSDSRAVIPGRYRDVGGNIGMTSGRIGKRDEGRPVVFQPLGGEAGSGTDDGNDEDRIVSFPVFHTEGDSSDSFVGLSLADAFAKRRSQFIEASQQRKAETHIKAKARLEATQRAAPIRFQKQPKAETHKKSTGSHSPTRKVTVAKTGSGTSKPVKRKPKTVMHGRTAGKQPTKPTQKAGASNVQSRDDMHTGVAPKGSSHSTLKGVAPIRASAGARPGIKPSSVGSSSGKTQQKQLGKMLATWKRSRTGTDVSPKT